MRACSLGELPEKAIEREREGERVRARVRVRV